MTAKRQGTALVGKTALITGAAKRLGRAMAVAFAEAGADVAVTYRTSHTEALETVTVLQTLGVRASAHHCDLDSPDSITAAVAAVLAAHQHLDILVNNAGTFASVPLQDITVAAWDATFSANTRAPFLVAQAAYPHLRETCGRILNIGSLGGLEPWATHAHYCASKAALHMLSKAMAKAWAPEVSVNCLAPGMIVMPGDEVDPAYQHFAGRTPMQRNGTPADVAAAALFFATCPHFITGQILGVDGGLGL